MRKPLRWLSATASDGRIVQNHSAVDYKFAVVSNWTERGPSSVTRVAASWHKTEKAAISRAQTRKGWRGHSDVEVVPVIVGNNPRCACGVESDGLTHYPGKQCRVCFEWYSVVFHKACPSCDRMRGRNA